MVAPRQGTPLTDTISGVQIAGTVKGAGQVVTASVALFNQMMVAVQDTSQASWEALRTARLNYMAARQAGATDDDVLGDVGTALAALQVPPPFYGDVAMQSAIVALFNAWEASASEGRMDTPVELWDRLRDARLLWNQQYYDPAAQGPPGE